LLHVTFHLEILNIQAKLSKGKNPKLQKVLFELCKKKKQHKFDDVFLKSGKFINSKTK